MADIVNVADKKQASLSPEQRQKIIKEILNGGDSFQTLANDKLYTLSSVYNYDRETGKKSFIGYSLAGGVKDVFMLSESGALYSVNQDLCHGGKCAAKEPLVDQVLLELQKAAQAERSSQKAPQKKQPEQQNKPRYSPEQRRIAVLYAEARRDKESGNG